MLEALPQLSPMQYQLVLNALNLAIALLGGSAILFVLLRNQVHPAYQMAISLMTIVVSMATYHYWRIYANWQGAYDLQNGVYIATGQPFNYAYRYADWIGTVPFILAAVVLVLDLGREKSSSLVTRMVLAAIAMIALGYVGEIERVDMTMRAVWGFASTVPFLYIVYVLWVEFNQSLQYESDRVRRLFSNMRLMLIATWGFYPIVYMFPMFGLNGAEVQVAIQVGNSISDVAAKAMFGLLIFAVAREKTFEAELQNEENLEMDFAGEPANANQGYVKF